MESTVTKPNLIKISLKGGKSMKRHIATTKAILVALEGQGLIFFKNEKFEVCGGNNLVIPAGEQHMLRAESDFSGYIIIEDGGDITFVNSDGEEEKS